MSLTCRRWPTSGRGFFISISSQCMSIFLNEVYFNEGDVFLRISNLQWFQPFIPPQCVWHFRDGWVSDSGVSGAVPLVRTKRTRPTGRHRTLYGRTCKQNTKHRVLPTQYRTSDDASISYLHSGNNNIVSKQLGVARCWHTPAILLTKYQVFTL